MMKKGNYAGHEGRDFGKVSKGMNERVNEYSDACGSHFANAFPRDVLFSPYWE